MSRYPLYKSYSTIFQLINTFSITNTFRIKSIHDHNIYKYTAELLPHINIAHVTFKHNSITSTAQSILLGFSTRSKHVQSINSSILLSQDSILIRITNQTLNRYLQLS
uniref:Uncharacterized protein n=1 Tax=Opuntia streptacantha TaxID=393608 RepID=A0A7C9ENY2_OPUST